MIYLEIVTAPTHHSMRGANLTLGCFVLHSSTSQPAFIAKTMDADLAMFHLVQAVLERREDVFVIPGDHEDLTITTKNEMGVELKQDAFEADGFGVTADLFTIADDKKTICSDELVLRLDTFVAEIKRERSDKIFEQYDFGDRVVTDHDGWDWTGDGAIYKAVYFEDGNSGNFVIEFESERSLNIKRVQLEGLA